MSISSMTGKRSYSIKPLKHLEHNHQEVIEHNHQEVKDV